MKFLSKSLTQLIHKNKRVLIRTIMADKNVTFESLNFDNLALRALPIDPISENYVREVPNSVFSRVKPMPLKNPRMVVYSKAALGLLDLTSTELERKEATEYLSGNKAIPGSEPASHCYCGHQFGVFAGQLGDGAAMYLGEVVNKKGEKWEIQFKGSGLTPYSRTADGRKVLRSTLREFLCSEAMHFLGVATTRAGSCVTSDSTVVRDMFYDGNPKLEKCAVVLRIAPTFIRFGSFEIFRPLDRTTGGRGPSFGREDIRIQLLDYVCDNFYKELSAEARETKYERVFEEIVKRTAKLVADWQCNGFVHGVLNTDNMSILGLTIDYGPYGFLDRYDPDFIFNGSDHAGRYTYRNQADICEWNCVKLAEVWDPHLPLTKSKEIVNKLFKKEFKKAYLEKMYKKFGLFTAKETDEKLFQDFMSVMYETRSDFTNSFRKLSELKLSGKDNIDADILAYLRIILKECCSVRELKDFLKPKFPKDTLDKLTAIMNEQPEMLAYFGLGVNMVKNQIEFSTKYEKIKDFKDDDKTKFDSDIWSNWLKAYLNRVYEDKGASNLNNYERERVITMNSNNPRFILRNHLAQKCIEEAEKENFLESKLLLKILENPFSDQPVEDLLKEFNNEELVKEKMESKFYETCPPPTKCVKLTCSS